MRAFLWLIVLTGALATTALAVNNGRASRGMHCGCKAAKDGCETPCSFCCGSGAMAACFANPDPTTAVVGTRDPGPEDDPIKRRCCGH